MNIKDLTKIGLCAALLCCSVLISVPIPFTPILITGQTVALNLIALVLKPKHSLICVSIYIFLGAVGLPVFSGAAAGFSVLLGPTGGFVFGFLIAAPVISRFKGDSPMFARYLAVTIFIGMPIIYLFGAGWYAAVADVNILTALRFCAVPFIPGDISKAVIASIIAVRVNAIEN